MISYVKTPNLPQGRVCELICGTDDRDILSFFAKEGIRVIKNAPNFYVDSAVSTHADMAAIHLGNSCIIVDKGQKQLSEELGRLGMTAYESRGLVEGTYPKDVSLNFAVVGSRMLGKISVADELLREKTQELEYISVNQGYCKCSVLVVNEKAIITDDEGIYLRCCEKFLDCLLVAKGDVFLEGHPYGFIGGASGKISRDEVVFFGDIKLHRDYAKINSFLEKHGCKAVCTDNGRLRDIGGIIPLTEKRKNY